MFYLHVLFHVKPKTIQNNPKQSNTTTKHTTFYMHKQSCCDNGAVQKSIKIFKNKHKPL